MFTVKEISRSPSIVILLAFCCCLQFISHADITLDAVSSAASTTSGIDVLSWEHQLGAGEDRLVVVFSGRETTEAIPNMTISSVTFNGVAMTLAPNSNASVGTAFQAHSSIYYILESSLPGPGTYTIQINMQGDAADILGGAISVIGTAQQGPELVIATTASDGADFVRNITTITDDSWIFDCTVTGVGADGDLTADDFTPATAGQDKQIALVGPSSSLAASTKLVADTGATTVGWNFTGTRNRNTHSAAVFAPASAFAGLHITTQPKGGIALVGGTWVFSVEVAGAIGEVKYQWFFNDQEIGTNSPMLVLESLSVSDSGQYRVEVSDDENFDASITVALSVASQVPVFWWNGLAILLLTIIIAASFLLRKNAQRI